MTFIFQDNIKRFRWFSPRLSVPSWTFYFVLRSSLLLFPPHREIDKIFRHYREIAGTLFDIIDKSGRVSCIIKLHRDSFQVKIDEWLSSGWVVGCALAVLTSIGCRRLIKSGDITKVWSMHSLPPKKYYRY